MADPWEGKCRQKLCDIVQMTKEIEDYLFRHQVYGKTDPNFFPTNYIRSATEKLVAEIDKPSGSHEKNIRDFIGSISDAEEEYNINNNVPPPHEPPGGGNPHKKQVYLWFEMVDDTCRKLHSYLNYHAGDKDIPAVPPTPSGDLDKDIEAFVDDIGDVVYAIDYHITHGWHIMSGKGGGVPGPFAGRKKKVDSKSPKK